MAKKKAVETATEAITVAEIVPEVLETPGMVSAVKRSQSDVRDMFVAELGAMESLLAGGGAHSMCDKLAYAVDNDVKNPELFGMASTMAEMMASIRANLTS